MIKLRAFPFDAKQNAKTILQVARGMGMTDVDAVIVWLDNEIRAQELDHRNQVKERYEIDSPYTVKEIKEQKKIDDRVNRSMKQAMIESNKFKKQLLLESIGCPSCKKGRGILDKAVGIRICVYPKTYAGGSIAMNHGCGWSRLEE